MPASSSHTLPIPPHGPAYTYVVVLTQLWLPTGHQAELATAGPYLSTLGTEMCSTRCVQMLRLICTSSILYLRQGTGNHLPVNNCRARMTISLHPHHVLWLIDGNKVDDVCKKGRHAAGSLLVVSLACNICIIQQ